MKVSPVRVVFNEKDRKEILAKIDDCLITGMVSQGKYVEEFENKWAAYNGVKYAIGVSNGSSAIEVAMRILDVKDKEVLVPVNTFAASAISIMLPGGTIRFVDTDPKTFCISLEELKRRVTPKTVGVEIVHIGGIITPEVEKIRDWCKENGLWLFEDCAHAHGSEMSAPASSVRSG